MDDGAGNGRRPQVRPRRIHRRSFSKKFDLRQHGREKTAQRDTRAQMFGDVVPMPLPPRVYAFETADKRVWLVLSCASPGCITSAAAPAATVGVHRGGMMVLHNNMTRSGRHAPGGAFSGASSGVTFLAASARRCHAANAPTGRGHVFSIQRSRVRVCLPPCGRRRATPWAKITTWGNGRR
jgi:hypothetical protein